MNFEKWEDSKENLSNLLINSLSHMCGCHKNCNSFYCDNNNIVTKYVLAKKIDIPLKAK